MPRRCNFCKIQNWSTSRDHGDSVKSSNVWTYTIAVSSVKKPVAFETSQERFTGIHRDLGDPVAVEEGVLQSLNNPGHPGAAAFQWNIELDEGEEYCNDIITAISDNSMIDECIKIGKTSEDIDIMFKKTMEYWQEYTSNLSIKTPDPEVDI